MLSHSPETGYSDLLYIFPLKYFGSGLPYMALCGLPNSLWWWSPTSVTCPRKRLYLLAVCIHIAVGCISYVCLEADWKKSIKMDRAIFKADQCWCMQRKALKCFITMKWWWIKAFGTELFRAFVLWKVYIFRLLVPVSKMKYCSDV